MTQEQAQHLGLTPEEVLALWEKGYYSPVGCLYHLLLSLRGENQQYQIGNVAEFCDRWKIDQRSFRWAFGQLVTDGDLDQLGGEQ